MFILGTSIPFPPPVTPHMTQYPPPPLPPIPGQPPPLPPSMSIPPPSWPAHIPFNPQYPPPLVGYQGYADESHLYGEYMEPEVCHSFINQHRHQPLVLAFTVPSVLLIA